MTTAALIIIGLIVLCWAAVLLFRMVAAIAEVVREIATQGAVFAFGRNSSSVQLIDPPELAQPLWPDPAIDGIVLSLREWKIATKRLPSLVFPVWKPMWLTDREGSNSAAVSDVEMLLKPLGSCRIPYEWVDNPPPFPEIALDFGGDAVPPPEPVYVEESYPTPSLKLPLWGAPFGFLNTFVRLAHEATIAKCRERDAHHGALELSARNLNRARRLAWTAAFEKHKRASDLEQSQIAVFRASVARARAAFELSRDADLAKLRDAKQRIAGGGADGVTTHFNLAMRFFVLPQFVPKRYVCEFDAETKTLLLEHQFPDIARLELPNVLRQNYNKRHTVLGIKARKELIAKIQPALCVQLARAIADADDCGWLDAIAVNGWVEFYDSTTGQPRRAYCASLIAKKDSLQNLRLETADVVAAFHALRGACAGVNYETVPLMPSLRMRVEDSRFVQARATTDRLATGENLAAMDWEDFEHFVRELFEREFSADGADVRITRASRDQGVDAVIFDPDPLRGGKIVVQAKRYTIPVGVSAVRDLYGSVLNEGANSGILVTTSHFGPDAYGFAQNKPLKLINGAQLLGLLDKAGYRFRINIEEARNVAKANPDRRRRDE